MNMQITKKLFFRSAILIMAATLTMSCGPKRERKRLSLKDPKLAFANQKTIEQAAVPAGSEAQVENLIGNYRGTMLRMGANHGYNMTLATEEVEIIETEKVYRLAKMTIDSNAQIESYLAIQTGSVGGTPAFAFTSTVLSQTAWTPGPFGIYLVLAHNNGQFLPAPSAIYMLDCGVSYSQTGTCTSNAAVSGATFQRDLNKY